jgi:uncharacterized DUF497 family protein
MEFGNNLFYEFEWDENKARINLAKHKISFDEGRTIFTDPFLITLPDDEHSDNEDRYISIGKSTNERILLVVHLERQIKIKSRRDPHHQLP